MSLYWFTSPYLQDFWESIPLLSQYVKLQFKQLYSKFSYIIVQHELKVILKFSNWYSNIDHKDTSISMLHCLRYVYFHHFDIVYKGDLYHELCPF